MEVGFKDYLGDAVYAQWDGYHIVLTTENGVAVLNIIYLDSHVWSALERFVKRLIEEREKANDEGKAQTEAAGHLHAPNDGTDGNVCSGA